MSAAVSAAIMAATTSNSVASAAAAAARTEARRAECKDWMTNFNHQNASTDQKRYYASCVQLIHPAQNSSPSVNEKIAVGSLLAWVILWVVFFSWREKGEIDGFSGWVILGFLQGLMGAFLAAVFIAVCVGLFQFFSR